MPTLSEIKTLSEAVDVALDRFDTRKEQIGFICLWECARLNIDLPSDSCFGAAVEHLLWKRSSIADAMLAERERDQ